jgi:hypothetical protein
VKNSKIPTEALITARNKIEEAGLAIASARRLIEEYEPGGKLHASFHEALLEVYRLASKVEGMRREREGVDTE